MEEKSYTLFQDQFFCVTFSSVLWDYFSADSTGKIYLLNSSHKDKPLLAFFFLAYVFQSLENCFTKGIELLAWGWLMVNANRVQQGS